MIKRILETALVTGLCLFISSCGPQIEYKVEIPRIESPQEYYAVFLNGNRIGHSIYSRTVEPNQVITASSEFMQLNRLGTAVSQQMYTKHVETLDGKPIAFKYLENSDSKTWFFRDKKAKTIKCFRNSEGVFKATKTVNGKTKYFEIDWPDDLLLSEGWRLLLKQTALEEGETFSGKEIFEYDPLEICSEQCRVGKTKQVSILDDRMRLTEVSGTIKSRRYGKISAVGYYDEDYNMKKVKASMGGIVLELVSCSPTLALDKVEQVDIIKMGLVQCPVRLKNPGKAKQITYYLKPTTNAALEIPSSDNQTVRRMTNGGLRVTVHPAKAPEGISFPYNGNDESVLEALKPTELLQSDHEKIIALSCKAVGNTKDAAKAARKIESFVQGYIHPSGGTALATALEVANERKGDCSEFAVLTAALCRAAGIPARIVMGYVYTDYYAGNWNVFGVHVWTEVYIDGKWIGLDATKNRFFGMSNSFSAGYIALSYPDSDASMSSASALAAFKIERVEQ